MPKVPQEVQFPDYYGTGDNDVIIDNNFGFYHGLGGNDLFVTIADEGQWSAAAHKMIYMNDWYYGGSGSDTVSYLASSQRIEASLESGIGNRMFGASVQSIDYFDS